MAARRPRSRAGAGRPPDHHTTRRGGPHGPAAPAVHTSRRGPSPPRAPRGRRRRRGAPARSPRARRRARLAALPPPRHPPPRPRRTRPAHRYYRRAGGGMSTAPVPDPADVIDPTGRRHRLALTPGGPAALFA